MNNKIGIIGAAINALTVYLFPSQLEYYLLFILLKIRKNNMASTLDYLEYVLELLNDFEDITYKKMMGEFLLYKNSIIFGGIYDNRFLIKKNPILDKYNLKEEIPYQGAKPMFLLDIINQKEKILMKYIMEINIVISLI